MQHLYKDSQKFFEKFVLPFSTTCIQILNVALAVII